MKTLVPTLLIVFSLTCFAFLPQSQAVAPPPDGGYPGGNTAEGQSALLGLTAGLYNTAVSIYSVLSLTDGNFCTGRRGDALEQHCGRKYSDWRRSAFEQHHR